MRLDNLPFSSGKNAFLNSCESYEATVHQSMTGSWWWSVLKQNNKKRLQISPWLTPCNLHLLSFPHLSHCFSPVSFPSLGATLTSSLLDSMLIHKHTLFSRLAFALFFISSLWLGCRGSILALLQSLVAVFVLSCACVCAFVCAWRLCSSDCTVGLLSGPQIKLPRYSRRSTHTRPAAARVFSNLRGYQL